MAFDPEAIQAALFTRLSGVAGLGTIKTRRTPDYSQLASGSLPAFTLEAGRGDFSGDNEPASSGTVRAIGVFYAKVPSDKTQTVETALFALWNAARALLKVQPGEAQPDPGNGTTLGGLVYSCVVRDYEPHEIEGSKIAALSFTIEMTIAE